MSDRIKPFETDEFSPETLEKFNKTNELRRRNSDMAGQIESYGASVELAIARVDHLLLGLTRVGAITADEYVEILLDWEETLAPQLQSVRDNARSRREQEKIAYRKNQRDQAQAAARRLKEASGGIVTPSTPRIILPGQ